MPNDVPPGITEDDREATVRRLEEAFAEGHISHARGTITCKRSGPPRPQVTWFRFSPRCQTPTRVAPYFWQARAAGCRRGAWRVPRVLKVESEYGKVDMDFVPGKSSRTRWSTSSCSSALVGQESRARRCRCRHRRLSTVWKQPIYKNPQLFDAAGARIRLSGTMDYWADLEHRGLLRPVCPRHPSNSLLILEWQVAPRLTIVTRCRDNMNERIHCTPSFLINLG